MTELKQNQVFSFEDGTLTIKMSGHGKADGWAVLSFPERQVEVDEGYHTMEIAPSELRALSKFLNIVVAKLPGAAREEPHGH